MPIRTVVAVASLIVAVKSLTASTQQSTQTPIFRSGVELVVVDATVLDKDGRPIADLQPGDFTVTVNGKKRPIVASQFVSSARAGASGTPATSANPPASQTPAVDLSRAIPATDTRTIVVAVDIESIRSGEGRIGMQNLADYFDTLPASDQIGVITLPWNNGRIELTSDRTTTRSVLTRLFGTDRQMRVCYPTLGETAAESAGDERGVQAYMERKNALGCPPPLRPLEKVRPEVRAAIEPYRSRGLQTLRNLSAISASLAERPGRRAIVFVSEGLFGDDDTKTELATFAKALERARVQLFAIHLDFPLVEASVKMASSLTRTLDDTYGYEAMGNAAIAGGGEAIRAISRTTPAIARIDWALSGSYVLAFDRIDDDKDGKRLSLKIQVSRKGADVRSRSHVTIGPS